jgi:IgA Peptidase M64
MSFSRASYILAAAIFCILTAWKASAQATLTTLFTNGPTAKRINLVALSEGYQASELTTFLVDAANVVSNLLAVSPYSEYSNYFNAFAISVASEDSGSSHPLEGVTNHTYFNSSFDSYGIPQLLTIPPNNYDSNYGDGQGKVDVLLTNMPEYDLVLLVVNDLEYGGSGGQTLITSLHPYAAEIVRHESGHTFGGLADEYTNAYPGYIPVEMPNVTAQTSRAQIKWTSWILGTTPIPTPPYSSNAAVVGLFEGAEYQATGWYRPKLDCRMRDLGTNFCEVCSEQLVKSVYGLVAPIDSFSPSSASVSVLTTQAVAFSVTPLQPATHNLAVQWYTNGAAVNGATNSGFQLLPQLLGDGTHTVKAVVHDPTALVRNDANGLLNGTNSWTVSISLNQLSLISAQNLPGSRFRFTVTGTAPQGFVIQASTNLANWSNWIALLTNNLVGGRFDYTNSGLANMPNRFYRTSSPP